MLCEGLLKHCVTGMLLWSAPSTTPTSQLQVVQAAARLTFVSEEIQDCIRWLRWATCALLEILHKLRSLVWLCCSESFCTWLSICAEEGTFYPIDHPIQVEVKDSQSCQPFEPTIFSPQIPTPPAYQNYWLSHESLFCNMYSPSKFLLRLPRISFRLLVGGLTTYGGSETAALH